MTDFESERNSNSKNPLKYPQRLRILIYALIITAVGGGSWLVLQRNIVSNLVPGNFSVTNIPSRQPTDNQTAPFPFSSDVPTSTLHDTKKVKPISEPPPEVVEPSFPTRVGIWLTPNYKDYGKRWGLEDLSEIFKPQHLDKWQEVRNNTAVLAFYDYTIGSPDEFEDFRTDTELKRALDLLKDSGIQIGLWSSLYGVPDNGSCDFRGAQDMWGDGTALKPAFERIRRNGGYIRYVLLDTPVDHGIEPPCREPREKVAREIGKLGTLIRTVFPKATIVDVENFQGNAGEGNMTVEQWKQHLRWVKQYDTARAVEYISIDRNIGNAGSGYDRENPGLAARFPWQEITEIEQYAKSLGFKVLNEHAPTRTYPDRPIEQYDPQTDEEFYFFTLDLAGEHFAGSGFDNDEELLSWMKIPYRALPENANYSFLHLARDIMRLKHSYRQSTLTLTADRATLPSGQTAHLKAFFDLDGPGPTPPQDVTKYIVTWRSSNYQIVTTGNTADERAQAYAIESSSQPITISATFAGRPATIAIRVVED